MLMLIVVDMVVFLVGYSSRQTLGWLRVNQIWVDDRGMDDLSKLFNPSVTTHNTPYQPSHLYKHTIMPLQDCFTWLLHLLPPPKKTTNSVG